MWPRHSSIKHPRLRLLSLNMALRLQHYTSFDDARRGFWGAYVPTAISWAYPEEAVLLAPHAFYWPFQTVGLTTTIFSTHFDLLMAGNLVAHFYGGSFQTVLDSLTPQALSLPPSLFLSLSLSLTLSPLSLSLSLWILILS